jgi:hypothetical protein
LQKAAVFSGFFCACIFFLMLKYTCLSSPLQYFLGDVLNDPDGTPPLFPDIAPSERRGTQKSCVGKLYRQRDFCAARPETRQELDGYLQAEASDGSESTTRLEG